MLNVLGIRLMGMYGDIRQMDSFKYSKKRVNLVMDMNDIIEPGSLDFDDDSYIQDKIEHEMDSKPIVRVKPYYRTGNGNLKTPSRAVFIISTEHVPKNNGTFREFTTVENELEQTFIPLVDEVIPIIANTRKELLSALKIPAQFRLVAYHGDLDSGLCCTDGHVDWTDFGSQLGNTGLLAMLPCNSADAEVEDDEGPFPLMEYLFPSFGFESKNKVNAVIATKGFGFHFDNGWRYVNGTHFEIQRWAYILKHAIKVGFKRAMQDMENHVKSNLEPKVVNELLGHEVILGFSGSICN